MAKFRVMAPDLTDPTLGGFPVEVSSHETYEKAVEVACKHAKEMDEGALNSVVQVEEDGTSNVATVHYHPEPPIETGGRDKQGRPEYKFEPEFRVVYDGTEVPQEEVEVNDDPEDHSVMLRTVPGAAPEGEHIVTDYYEDGTEVDRSDLLP